MLQRRASPRPTNNGERQQRRCRQGDRERAEEGRGGLCDAVPRPCHHGADELHGDAFRRTGPRPGCRRRTPKPRSRRCRRRRAFRSTNARSIGPTSAAASAGAAARRTTSIRRSPSPRNSPDTPVKMIWIARGGSWRTTSTGRSRSAKMSAGLDDARQSRRIARPRLRPVDQRLPQSGAGRRRQGHAAAAGLYDEPGEAQLGYDGAQHADRICDAQHPCAGRALARRQHQPERRLHGMLHGRGGAGGRPATRSNSAAR